MNYPRTNYAPTYELNLRDFFRILSSGPVVGFIVGWFLHYVTYQNDWQALALRAFVFAKRESQQIFLEKFARVIASSGLKDYWDALIVVNPRAMLDEARQLLPKILNDKLIQTVESRPVTFRKTRRRKKPAKVVNEKKRKGARVVASTFFGDLKMAYRYHSGNGFEGEAYGVTWTKGPNGCIVEDLRAVHSMEASEVDESKHQFPDMQGKFVPKIVPDDAELEVATPEGLVTVTCTARMLSWGKTGTRYIWGMVPAFKCDKLLVSGAPIFYQRRLVSVVTRSDGDGYYAVSGIGRPSGHSAVRDFRVCRAQAGYSVYGNLVSTYAIIKAEALRPKGPDTGCVAGAQLVMFPDGRLDYVEWSPNNSELCHLRMDARDTKVVAID